MLTLLYFASYEIFYVDFEAKLYKLILVVIYIYVRPDTQKSGYGVCSDSGDEILLKECVIQI